MLRAINRTRLGVTLLELMIVTAIIAALSSILFPVFVKARHGAKGNQGQTQLAYSEYAQDNDDNGPIGTEPADSSQWSSPAAVARFMGSATQAHRK